MPRSDHRPTRISAIATFDYVVSLAVGGRRCVVLGGGATAVERAQGLADAGADVEIYAESGEAVEAFGDPRDDGPVVHHRRYRLGDLDGAFLAIATRENDTDVDAAWAEAEDRGVLFAALDDIPHCHFAAPATVDRGDLTFTVSTAGRAPALSKRLRQQLEQDYDDIYGELVDVLHEAREEALPRQVSFGEWADRWADALSDLDRLAERIRGGDREGVRRTVLATLRGEVVGQADDSGETA